MSDAAKYAPLSLPSDLGKLRSSPGLLLDRAMRGALTSTAVASDFGYVSLNNNATQQFYLVVRNIEWGPSTVGPATLIMVQALATGGAAGVVSPVLPDRAALPGYLEKANLIAAPTGDYVIFNQSIGVSTGSAFPIAVLPPGWQLRVAAGVVDVAMTVSFIWEVLTPDEFTKAYGLSPG